ncbi:hypothetical protein KKH23_03740 [Patescibacteria group bacterium]|nr:hypothetical protein [Patescibacteria group bacterium]MBU0777294.1 hypothetical protein [Patescibacteria group bacterium]MBU0846277.1 hypothetical protein [Patescibacteria group bacterium]MBU0923180.1 hypothetical protein [Patescibacteria group bacterium]MBU1066894.1 hypothetical protein [Patescibacteria group bacterium]
MKKLLIYYNFIIVTLMIVAGFLGTGNYAQLASAVLFFPLAAYFLFLVLPNRNKAIIFPELRRIGKTKDKKAETGILKAEKIEDDGPDKKRMDANRRAFVKLIGSAGVTLFLFSIFTKKAQGAFFGSVPGPGTVALKDTTDTQIDPAIKLPTDGYKISGIDDSSPAYYGFVDKDGDWFIMQETSAGQYKYYKKTDDDNDFETDWLVRGGFTYRYFDAIF